MRLSTVTTFGSTDVARCQAKSKRSGVLCRKAAMSQGCYAGQEAKEGPLHGRKRLLGGKGVLRPTVHGRETRAIRAARDAKLRELREMEQTLKNAGLII